jgi:hypothetical protein
MFSQHFSGDSADDLSCRWRTLRNATRVFLATRVYRAAHGGALPSNPQALLPLLGAWPIDFYDGKPMRYDAKKEVVYAVGKNLVDDGGDFGMRLNDPNAKDIGLSLKFQP